MVWALLSVLSGLGDAVSFAMMKKLINLDHYVILLCRHLVTLPFLLFGFLFYDVPKVSLNFYVVVFINVIILLIAVFIMIRSLEISDMSASIPMLSFTPIFLLFVSFVLLQEFPTFVGLIGIFIVVIGHYIIHLSSLKQGYLEPLKSIFKNKGIFYMFIVSFLFSINATISKIGINLSNPSYYIFMNYLLASVFLSFMFYSKIGKNYQSIKKNANYIVLLGISTAFMELLVAIALKLAIVPYVISLKRSSVIFSVIIGVVLFKEKHFSEAFIGSVIMFTGATLILLS